MDRRREIPKSGTKDFITSGTASNMSFWLLWAPLTPKVPGSKSCYACNRFLLHLKNHGCRESKSFIMCTETCLPFAPERDLIFIILNSSTPCSWLQQEALILSSKAVPCPNILENTAQDKGHWCLSWEDNVKAGEAHGELHPNIF